MDVNNTRISNNKRRRQTTMSATTTAATLLMIAMSCRSGTGVGVECFSGPGAGASIVRRSAPMLPTMITPPSTTASPVLGASCFTTHVDSLSSALWSTPEPFDGGGPSLKEKEQQEKRREYELAIGKAADTLRTDYPKILSHCPRLDIFDDDIELVDPSGVKLHGIQNYKRTFGILRAVIKFFYNEDQSEVTSRMMFDSATKAIRVTWHATLVPKVIYGGPARTVYLDGISVYEMSRSTCRIHQHRLERACMNNQPIRYPQGIWSALNTEVVERHGIPVGGGLCSETLSPSSSSPAAKSSKSILAPAVSSSGGMSSTGSSTRDGNLWKYGDTLKRGSGRHLMHGQGAARRILAASGARRSTRLQMSSPSSTSLESGTDSGTSTSKEGQDMAAPMAASTEASAAVEAAASAATEVEIALENALELKNRSRMKFGLMPMTMDEFMIQRQQVQVLERQQKKKMHTENKKRVVAAEAALAAEEKKQARKSPFDAFFAAVTPDRCESNEDCEEPLVCCDFVFKKICCASGVPVGHYNALEQHLAYVPVPAQPDPEFPEQF